MIYLMLYGHGKRLRSCRGEGVSYLTTPFLGKPPEALHEYLFKNIVPIFSPITGNLPFLSQRKRDNFHQKMFRTRGSIFGALVYEEDTLPIELPNTDTSETVIYFKNIL